MSDMEDVAISDYKNFLFQKRALCFFEKEQQEHVYEKEVKI